MYLVFRKELKKNKLFIIIVLFKKERIYLYKTANKSVSYDDDNWYIDDNPQSQKDEDNFENYKIYATAQSYNNIAHDITKYINRFYVHLEKRTYCFGFICSLVYSNYAFLLVEIILASMRMFAFPKFVA